MSNQQSKFEQAIQHIYAVVREMIEKAIAAALAPLAAGGKIKASAIPVDGSTITITTGGGGGQVLSGSGGTATSVGLAAPASILSVSGSPVTHSGTITLALATQVSNTVWAGPTSGIAATPTFRGLVSADIPSLDAAKIATGTFAGARIPVDNSTIIISGSAVTGNYQAGSGVTIAGNTISVTGGGAGLVTLPIARTDRLGGMKPDGPTLWTSFDGTTSVIGIAPTRTANVDPTDGGSSTVDNAGGYNAFPWLCEAMDGTLLATYRHGSAHVSLDGLVTLKKSTNGGATWGSRQTITTPAVGRDYRSPSTALIRDTGRLVLVWWEEDATPLGVGLWVAYSDNNAGSWTILPVLTPFTLENVTEGAPLVHSSGVLVWPIYGTNTGDTADRPGSIRSTDNALTWSATPAYMGPANTNQTEATLIELADTRIVAFIRQEGGTSQPIYTSVSLDVGLTWSVPAALGWNAYPGRPAAIVFPDSQVIMLFYRGTTGEHMVYRVSLDGGATWEAEVLFSSAVYLYAGGIALAGNKIGLAYSLEVNSATATIGYQVYNESGGALVVGGAPITLRRNGSLVGTEPGLNLIPGTNVAITAADNPGSNRLDVTIAASAPLATASAAGLVKPDNVTTSVDGAGVLSAIAGLGALGSLTDVYLHNLQDGDTLSYSLVLGQWVNSSAGFGYDVVDDLTGFSVLDDVSGFQVISDPLPTLVVADGSGAVLLEDGTGRRIVSG